MIVVRSENGRFLGDARTLHVMRYTTDGKWKLVANWRIAENDRDDYDLLAEYKTEEAAIKQIDDMQRFIVEMRDGSLTASDDHIYDLRECKIKE